MTSLPRRLLAALLTAGLLTTAACGEQTVDERIAEASEDGELIVYSGRNEKLIGPLLEKFEQASGVDVTARYAGSAELAAQLLEEGGRTPAAVFLSQDAGALGAVQEAGLLAPLEEELLAKVPERYRSDEGAWVGVSGRSRVLAYNPGEIPESDLPQTVFDLTDPRFKGKIGVAPTNASFHSFVTAMRVSAGEERTREFLEGLKANEPKTYNNNLLVLDAVDKGEVAVGLVNHYYLLEKAAEAGGLEKLTARNHVFPGDDPGSLVNVAGVAVLKGNESGDARAFVEYLLGPEAQTYFAEETKEYPLASGVEADLEDMPPLEELQGPDIDLSELSSLQETLALLDEVGLT
ncbi:iron(III) transport system substrate-binding protein [Kineococcus xinjiangensis]|uniref:Iron(III) transport system substrate-binding protein n=1 Tax=Kineococcus xinjiangensis TaxID=512762 RepID=A0A2S6ITV7_9ACTN|nr:iron ABC transporter substrate-binding protein [Kineococcus xinjiangensis]PPK97610.1 iron(III) transport system substrate-binding protein [Kineococcus xinjiangensis]